MARPRRRPTADDAGFSALEVLFVAATLVTVGGLSVPPMVAAVDEVRTAGAARYVAARFQRARMDAVLRSTGTSVRFTVAADGVYEFATYVDGNGDGVLTKDIQRGVDVRVGGVERLRRMFTGVEFGTVPGLPAVDSGGTPPGNDPVHFGSGSLATFNAAGTASSGSVYVLGPRGRQYVVRVYGDTGKVRILRFDGRSRRWEPLT